jgi:hypothetical protein
MINLSQFIESARRLAGIKTRTPPWAVVAFVILNEKTGAVVAYVDPTTGNLFNGANSLPFSTAQSLRTQVVTTATGAITIQNSTVLLTGTGVQAMTLAAPSAAQAGTRIFVTSTSAHAHTITATSLINDGATGVPHTTATFAAFAGAGIEFEAYNGLWQVVSNNNVTVS